MTSSKERRSFWISIVALGLSSVSVLFTYLTNFHVENEVVARIIEVSSDPPPSQTVTKYSKDGFVVLAVAFANTGNRPAVIGLPKYDLGIRQPGVDEPQGLGGEVAAPENVFPFVLPVHEIRVVPLRIPVSCMLARFQQGLEVPSSPGEVPRRNFDLGLSYLAVDASGQQHSAWSGRLVDVQVSRTALAGLGPIQESTAPVTRPLRATRLFSPGTVKRPSRSFTVFQPLTPDCDELLR